MKSLSIIIITSFLFLGCSSKDPQVNIQKDKKENTLVLEDKNEEFDDFESEFEDEFSEVKKEEDFDPLSGYNRMMTSFNDKFYTYVLTPVSDGYKVVVPEEGRVGISNFFNNLMFPIRFVNNILQLKFENSVEELGRFMVNSTVGFFGFFDPATTHFKLEAHNEDFGQTLGYYGVGEGFHVVLPFLGPSNLRDMVGLSVDSMIDPTTNGGYKYQIPNNLEKSIGLKSLKIVNQTSFDSKKYENLKKDAIDLYPFLKEVYNQKRKREIEE